MPETLLSTSTVYLFGLVVTDLAIQNVEHTPFPVGKLGSNNQMGDQLDAKKGPRFARIYGFGYQGVYYDLQTPALFLVHGDGGAAAVARPNAGDADGEGGAGGVKNPARAPGEPTLTGVAAADFQLADDLRVWAYDKSDFTIRMDTENGMFEDVLLDPFFGDEAGGGGRVSGARVSGARVSGARVSGARVSGARLSGGRDGSD